MLLSAASAVWTDVMGAFLLYMAGFCSVLLLLRPSASTGVVVWQQQRQPQS
jgi:hypothetical protein